jgi:mycothiol S-conjugate amidase
MRRAQNRPVALPLMTDQLCLMTVHAHPDDEASKGAPTVALYKSRGAKAVLVCCTGGEEGDLQNPALAAEGGPLHGLEGDALKAAIGAMRPGELAASVAAIGYDECVMLGYRDSGMADTPPNDHPDSFHSASLDDSTERLVAAIRQHRPQVLLTYADNQEGYPHPDHLKVYDISMTAWERSGDPDWYPNAGEPWQISKLYMTMWSRARMVAYHQAFIDRDGKSPFDEKWFERPDQDHRITTRIDIRGWNHVRTAALKAHATQVDPAEPWWFGLSETEMDAAYGTEDWVLHRSIVDTQLPETDLFAGVVAAADAQSEAAR